MRRLVTAYAIGLNIPAYHSAEIITIIIVEGMVIVIIRKEIDQSGWVDMRKTVAATSAAAIPNATRGHLLLGASHGALLLQRSRSPGIKK
jgi:hypothetical protein